MPEYSDQTGRTIALDAPPKRIVSTVPSQTELLYDLGLEQEVVGITAYCEHPPHWKSEKAIIGGTKDLQIEKIRDLQPDLVIGNKEENIREQYEAIGEFSNYWISDVETVDDALEMISSIGKLTNTYERAEELRKAIEAERKDLAALPASPKTAFYIWKDPWMLAGNDTFIGAMLEELGWQNIAPSGMGRYPVCAPDELEKYNPDIILLTSEPYAFKSSDSELLMEDFPGTLIKQVDGQLFSWYGSRMLSAFRYLQRLQGEIRLYWKSAPGSGGRP